MLRTTLHCDGCLRTQVEAHGWFLLSEAVSARVLNAEATELGVERALIVRDIKPGELPAAGKAYCGVECVTRALHAWTELVMREQVKRKAE